MISDLLFSLNAVVPIFILMFLGVAVKRLGIIDALAATNMNALVFKVALPVMLFNTVYGSDFSQMLDLRFIAFLIISIFAFFFICWAIAAKLIPDNKKKGAFVQGSFRGNYVILGVALATEILGFTPILAATGVIIVVLLFNILSVVILTVYSEQKVTSKSVFISITKSIVTNPLVIAIIAGVIVALSGFEIFPFLISPINMVSSLATPLALIVIGASLDLSKIKDNLKYTLIASTLKLIIKPLIFLPVALWLGMSSEAIVVLLVLYASPTAIVSYVMAFYMGSDEHLASSIVIFSSLSSIVTYTIGVFILRAIGIV